jgi:hypothetical protein
MGSGNKLVVGAVEAEAGTEVEVGSAVGEAGKLVAAEAAYTFAVEAELAYVMLAFDAEVLAAV